MRLPLPPLATPTLRAALTEPAALRAWWDPDASVESGVLTPGVYAPTARITASADAVVWRGDRVQCRFDLDRLVLEVAFGGDERAQAELALGCRVALATLAWANGRTTVGWHRLELPVALSYHDAWGRIDRSIGANRVRIAGEELPVEPLLVEPPRAVVLALPGRLLRLALAPGPSVNAAYVDVLGEAPPPSWDRWFAHRFRMTWEDQLPRP